MVCTRIRQGREPELSNASKTLKFAGAHQGYDDLFFVSFERH
jgi:hypothetical protein